MGSNKMKAAYRKKYGPPDSLKIKELEIPKVKENEILIKVHAATVNRTDCAVLSGSPYIMRLFTGLLKPKLPITGTDFAGKVEAIGNKVSSFKVDNRVFGFNDTGLASHAQYMTISEDKDISLIPEKLSYEEAAASLEGAHYAYNFIKKVKVKKGDKILINGATGAIGSALLQFSKYYGAYVTAVGNSKNIKLMKSLGADNVIDYQTEAFTEDNQKYKYIFDAVGKSSFAKCKNLLETDGVYISSELGRLGENFLLALITKISSGKKVIFPVPTDIKASIDFIKKLIEEDKFKAVIDRKYLLEEISEAFNYTAGGQKTGNVLLKIN
ncbi:NADPH:quinone reductase-like Zn-dependent oxidoreductase [Halanaerobium saccharolyticum]|uniref:NADPH:quinone reductase-like Zn-dependent oxidoreductase n=1 Tax=Halanaerobium saccharolyticum TaxID=43595 RepID=A0A4R6LCN0_9FIRM|nr:NAD(P)-dependent alcohol dehydrogenase [Halanaerobium saccharolyticum]TDO73396.1 NADPH:quinone reductase-like Zn-dependent oxidoreductase [Halanaerobium saccharolyticum]